MSGKRKTALQQMDALVWWSNASSQVRHDMSRDNGEARRQPMRWLPLLPMAFGAGLLAWATAFSIPGMAYGVAGPVMAVAAAIANKGPLGKPSINDDEYEAALRKNAFFFCMACLAVANIVGGPALLLAAGFKGWATERLVGIAFALFMANMIWFASLPTLYASWKLPALSDDEG